MRLLRFGDATVRLEVAVLRRGPSLSLVLRVYPARSTTLELQWGEPRCLRVQTDEEGRCTVASRHGGPLRFVLDVDRDPSTTTWVSL